MCSVMRLDVPDAVLNDAFCKMEAASKHVDKLYDTFVESFNGRRVGLGFRCDVESFRKSIDLMKISTNEICFVRFPHICLNAHLNVLSASQLMLENFKLNQKMKLEYKMNIQRVILKFSGKNVLDEKSSKTFESALKENNIDLNNYKMISKGKQIKIKKTPKKIVQVKRIERNINVSGFLAKWLS